jgi:exopolysaccharide production protein ExoZ
LFPPYLPVSIAMILFYSMAPALSAQGGRDFSLLSSLFLIPADKPPALNVAWTLVHELIFYVMFMTFFVSARVFAVLLAAWAAVIVAIQSISAPSGWASYPLSLLNIEFMFGVLAALYVRRWGARANHRLLVAIGSACGVSALVFISPENLDWVRVVFALGLALIVVGYVLREQLGMLKWHWFFLAIGNASYSIYLVHNPLLSVTQRIAGKLEMSWLAALLAGVGISLLAGYVYSRLVEMPTAVYLRGRMQAA